MGCHPIRDNSHSSLPTQFPTATGPSRFTLEVYPPPAQCMSWLMEGGLAGGHRKGEIRENTAGPHPSLAINNQCRWVYCRYIACFEELPLLTPVYKVSQVGSSSVDKGRGCSGLWPMEAVGMVALVPGAPKCRYGLSCPEIHQDGGSTSGSEQEFLETWIQVLAFHS